MRYFCTWKSAYNITCREMEAHIVICVVFVSSRYNNRLFIESLGN